MKKLLVLMLVLGLVTMANATIIDVVQVGLGDMGHSGTELDPLELSETIDIKLVLNHYPSAYGSQYDGYALSSMDLDLHIIGKGSLGGTVNKVGDIWHNNGFGAWGDSGITPTGVDQMGGVASPIIAGSAGGTDLVWNLTVHCDGPGPITIDLTLNGLSEYSNSSDGAGNMWPPIVAMTEASLGDLVIYNIPEPMSIALLGLGGLFLRRRK